MDEIGLGCGRRSWAGRGYRCLLAALVLASVAGCQQYNWRTDYKQAEQEAREQNKHLLVFYKWCWDSDSNWMLRETLSEPAVVALFQDTINLLLDKVYGPEYVEYVAKYGATSYPASVIVAPDGQFKVLLGKVSKERFIEFVKEAKPSRPVEPAGSKGG